MYMNLPTKISISGEFRISLFFEYCSWIVSAPKTLRVLACTHFRLISVLLFNLALLTLNSDEKVMTFLVWK